MSLDYSKLQNGSDIRGVALPGEEGKAVNLTRTEAIRLTLGFAKWLSEKTGKEAGELKFSVGHDSRLTAGELKSAICDAFGIIGAEVLLYFTLIVYFASDIATIQVVLFPHKYNMRFAVCYFLRVNTIDAIILLVGFLYHFLNRSWHYSRKAVSGEMEGWMFVARGKMEIGVFFFPNIIILLNIAAG